MTVHQAKGNEFDAVILVNAGPRQFADNDVAGRGPSRWVWRFTFPSRNGKRQTPSGQASVLSAAPRP